MTAGRSKRPEPVPFAVSLLLDDASAGEVERLWSALAEADLSRSMLELGHPPHVTLGVYEHLDTPATIRAIEALLVRAVRLPVRFNDIGVFPGEPGVLYLGPASDELASIHRHLHHAVGDDAHPHYRPESWVPHCTLATGLSPTRLDAARALIAGLGPTIGGMLDAIDLVRFSPIESLWRRPLGHGIV